MPETTVKIDYTFTDGNPVCLVDYNGVRVSYAMPGDDVLEEALALYLSPGEILKRMSLRQELSDTERLILNEARKHYDPSE